MYSEDELRRIVKRDFRGQRMIRPGDWLSSKEGVLTWYRELRRVGLYMSRQIARRRARLKLLRPPPGAQPTNDYLVAKQDFELWHDKVVDLVGQVDEAKQHVLSLVDKFDLDVSDRTAIEAFSQILDHIKTSEDPATTIKRIERIARRALTKHYRRQLAKSSTTATP